jgi:ribonuclease Z
MTRITFLGTADSIPSTYRNHNAILIASGKENILVDCGEGTQRQFRKAKLNPCKVTKILLTHWHGDHVLGLPGLLSTLALSGYNKTLNIYGPKGTKTKFEDMMQVFSFRRDYDIIFNETSAGRIFEDDDIYLSAEEMEHGVPCLAYSFVEKGHTRIKPEKVKELGSGRHMKDLIDGKDIIIDGKKVKSKDCIYKEEDKKIAIVMDTKMNDKIVPFVRGADIFVSEGTYSKELKKEADEKMHLTVEQVAKVAKKAKVKKLVVTHVSSRYLRNLNALLSEAKDVFVESYMSRDLDFFDL